MYINVTYVNQNEKIEIKLYKIIVLKNKIKNIYSLPMEMHNRCGLGWWQWFALNCQSCSSIDDLYWYFMNISILKSISDVVLTKSSMITIFFPELSDKLF